MSPDKRVYDAAKELGISNKEVIDKLNSIGIKIKSHSSTLSSFQFERLKEMIKDGVDNKSKKPKAFVVKKSKSKVEETKTSDEKDLSNNKNNDGDKNVDIKPRNNTAISSVENKSTEIKKPKPDIRDLLIVKHQRPSSKNSVKKNTVSIENSKTSEDKKNQLLNQTNKNDNNSLIKSNVTGNKINTNIGNTQEQQSTVRKSTFQQRNIRQEFNEKIKVQSKQASNGNQNKSQTPNSSKQQGTFNKNNKQNVSPSNNDSGNKKPIIRHVISQEIYDKGTAHKKDTRPKNKEKTYKSKEELQEMISLEKAMTQKHKKKQKEEVQDKTITQIVLDSSVTVGELAKKINKSPADVVRFLMMSGILATVNQVIDIKTAKKVCEYFEIEVLEEDLDAYVEEELKKEEKLKELESVDEKLLVPRAPVVSIMGHVDHGKTTLLDSIRASKHKIVSDEVGGITQSIGAYTVFLDDKKIVFIDTPGHEAFTEMRARGAKATDIAILVVAADDGIMPQTIEAINHAKAAEVAIIVAINKIDKPSANPEKIMQQLTEYGLVPEEWGGDTVCVKVSAIQGTGIDELLEYILLHAEMLSLKANPQAMASGVVIEANLDKGKGPVATLLVQNGTLKVGDSIVVGSVGGKVRALLLDSGEKVKKAGPATPVEILGLNEVPQAGDSFNVVENDKVMKQIIQERKENDRNVRLEALSPTFVRNEIIGSDDTIQHLNLIIKANTHGAAEAVSQAITQLESKEIVTKLVHVGVGDISEADVMLASASNAIILGFTVKEDANALAMAEQNNVIIKNYNIIYQVLEDIEKTMLDLLKPELKEVELGKAEVRQIFTIGKTAKIAGCYVLEGKILRGSNAVLIRNGKEIFQGQIDQLKRFKDDVKEVATGFECGISFSKFNDLEVGDIIQVSKTEEVERKVLV